MNLFHRNPAISQTSQASCLVRWAISRHKHQASQGEAAEPSSDRQAPQGTKIWTSKEKWLNYVEILYDISWNWRTQTFHDLYEKRIKQTDIPDKYQNLDHVGVATKVKYIEQNAHLPEPICMQGMPQPWNSTPPQKNGSGNSHIQFWGFNNLPVASNHQLRPQSSILTSAWKGHFRRHWRHAWPCSNNSRIFGLQNAASLKPPIWIDGLYTTHQNSNFEHDLLLLYKIKKEMVLQQQPFPFSCMDSWSAASWDFGFGWIESVPLEKLRIRVPASIVQVATCVKC